MDEETMRTIFESTVDQLKTDDMYATGPVIEKAGRCQYKVCVEIMSKSLSMKLGDLHFDISTKFSTESLFETIELSMVNFSIQFMRTCLDRLKTEFDAICNKGKKLDYVS